MENLRTFRDVLFLGETTQRSKSNSCVSAVQREMATMRANARGTSKHLRQDKIVSTSFVDNRCSDPMV